VSGSLRPTRNGSALSAVVEGSADSKGADSKGADSKGADSKGADSKGADSKGADSKGAVQGALLNFRRTALHPLSRERIATISS
jgi:uncharacterized protein YjbI with pentapeptide repeats